MPVLEIQLEAEERIVAVSGELSWMTSTIDLTTTTQWDGGGGLVYDVDCNQPSIAQVLAQATDKLKKVVQHANAFSGAR